MKMFFKGSELSISQKSSREISDFLVRGKLDSCIVNLNGALSGLIVVEKSERPIKSLELQLIRMESIAADEIKGQKKSCKSLFPNLLNRSIKSCSVYRTWEK